ncbi:Uncharacterised protein [Achromobacter sp. 2789STDY5608633]|nr:Uncharacterised protein [Achromobacter sp. 2789STDY5608633]
MGGVSLAPTLGPDRELFNQPSGHITYVGKILAFRNLSSHFRQALHLHLECRNGLLFDRVSQVDVATGIERLTDLEHSRL